MEQPYILLYPNWGLACSCKKALSVQAIWLGNVLEKKEIGNNKQCSCSEVGADTRNIFRAWTTKYTRQSGGVPGCLFSISYRSFQLVPWVDAGRSTGSVLWWSFRYAPFINTFVCCRSDSEERVERFVTIRPDVQQLGEITAMVRGHCTRLTKCFSRVLYMLFQQNRCL